MTTGRINQGAASTTAEQPAARECVPGARANTQAFAELFWKQEEAELPCTIHFETLSGPGGAQRRPKHLVGFEKGAIARS